MSRRFSTVLSAPQNLILTKKTSKLTRPLEVDVAAGEVGFKLHWPAAVSVPARPSASTSVIAFVRQDLQKRPGGLSQLSEPKNLKGKPERNVLLCVSNSGRLSRLSGPRINPRKPRAENSKVGLPLL
jgi:hypothetical protein